MPYISKAVKASLKDGRKPTVAGELNFTITTAVDSYLVTRGVSYTSINEAIGALECAKLELYRRVAAPYEELKRAENGEVYVSVSR